MEFVNLCPHAISVMGGDGNVTTFQPSGTVARVSATPETLPEVAGFRLVRNSFGPVTGLPAPLRGVMFIVSGMVLSALSSTRPDVVAPDTGPSQVRFSAEDEANGLGKAGQTRYVTGFVA